MAAEKAAPLPLSVVFVKEEKKKHAPAGAPFLPVPGVRDVIKWALLNAGCTAFSVAYGLVVSSISHPPTWLPGVDPEPEKATMTNAASTMTDVAAYFGVMLGALWCVCVVSQAAAGALALALPRHRFRLAYAALVATTGGHCIWFGVYIIPGGLSFWDGVSAVAIFACVVVVDLLCFRGLFVHGGEE